MSRHNDGRARLLAAARRVAADFGAARVSLRDIAKAANYSPAACYRYFPSREALIDALASEISGEIGAAMTKGVGEECETSEKLAAAAHAYLQYAVVNRGPFELAFGPAEGGWVTDERRLAGMRIADQLGDIAGRPDLGACLWGAIHGLVELLLRGAIDVGQREQGIRVLASRGDTLLRGLIERLAV